jgi:hypothetical protein
MEDLKFYFIFYFIHMNRKITKNQSFEFDENDNPITDANSQTPNVPENKNLLVLRTSQNLWFCKEVKNPVPAFEDLIDKEMLEKMISSVSDNVVKPVMR